LPSPSRSGTVNVTALLVFSVKLIASFRSSVIRATTSPASSVAAACEAPLPVETRASFSP
jgi:hypothetical protein